VDIITSYFSHFPPYFYRDPKTAYIGTSSVPFIDNSRAPGDRNRILNISAITKYYSKSFGQMIDNYITNIFDMRSDG
jgi:hypothetical protein